MFWKNKKKEKAEEAEEPREEYLKVKKDFFNRLDDLLKSASSLSKEDEFKVYLKPETLMGILCEFHHLANMCPYDIDDLQKRLIQERYIVNDAGDEFRFHFSNDADADTNVIFSMYVGKGVHITLSINHIVFKKIKYSI